MAIEETVTAIRENGGTLFGMLVAGAAAFAGLWKLLPIVNSNLTNVAKSNTIQNEMLTTLRLERDAALQKLEALRDKYDQLFREWSTLNAQLESLKTRMEALQNDLGEANEVISSLRGHVRKAAKTIDATADPALLIERKKGDRHD